MSYIVSKRDLDEFTSFDVSRVWHEFPQQTHVLTIHGLQDRTVPPYDATIYARALSSRVGTHNLCLVEEADHNFTKRQDEVVSTILAWLAVRDELRTGVWLSVEAKL